MHYREAENWVCQHLEERGWKILTRNFRKAGFELDIVASKQNTLTIVEVKLRARPPRHGWQLTALLSQRKQLALRRGALCYLSAKKPAQATLRFDLAVVSPAPSPDKAKADARAIKPCISYFVNVIPEK